MTSYRLCSKKVVFGNLRRLLKLDILQAPVPFLAAEQRAVEGVSVQFVAAGRSLHHKSRGRPATVTLPPNVMPSAANPLHSSAFMNRNVLLLCASLVCLVVVQLSVVLRLCPSRLSISSRSLSCWRASFTTSHASPCAWICVLRSGGCLRYFECDAMNETRGNRWTSAGRTVYFADLISARVTVVDYGSLFNSFLWPR